MTFRSDDIKDEIGIVWLADPLKFKYLREGLYDTTKRSGKIGIKWAMLVGYAEHRKRPGGIQVYRRRFWWLKDYDRDLDPGGIYAEGSPTEAVAPASIRAGFQSVDFEEGA